MSEANRRRIKNILICVACPLVLFGLMEALCLLITGEHLITSKNLVMVMRRFTTTTCLAIALSMNITAGRFDFSLGSVLLGSAIIGGNVAISLNMGGVGILVFAIITGMVMSGIVGVLYCLTKIAPMVLSLGMALVMESVTFLLFKEGLNLKKAVGDVTMLSDPFFMLAIVAIVLLLFTFLSEKTVFGFQRRSLGTGQAVAVNAGVKEIPNTILCYVLSGGLVAVVGTINSSYRGIISPSLGLASVSSIFTAMLPVFLGGFMASFSNDTLGKVLACLMVTILNTGMTAFGLNETTQSLINALILILFLLFMFNAKDFAKFSQSQLRKREAAAAQK